VSEHLVPPSDLDAEATVLSAVLVQKGALEEVDHFLKAAHFYADANRWIWEAVTDLASAGKPTDPMMVAGWLRDHNRLAQVGGASYIAQLVETVPPTVRLAATAMRIVDKWRLRRIIDEARAIVAEAYTNADDVAGFVQRAEARIFGASQSLVRTSTIASAGEVMRECIEEARETRDGSRPRGISTGFASLDKRIGGLRGGRVYVCAGRPGMGKTSFATKAARTLAKSTAERRGVFFASVEMPRKQIGDRLIAQEAQLDTRAVEMAMMNRGEWEDYTNAANRIAQWPLIIEDRGGLTLSDLRSSLRRAVRRLESVHETSLGLICIDYLQLMSTADLGKGMDPNQRLELLSAALVAIAKEFDVPVVLLSQLNRECEKRVDKRPILADLRGSGAIEQDAHTIIFFYREDVYRAPGDAKDRSAEIIVAKARGGRTGTVRADYLEYCTEFLDRVDDDPHDAFARQFDDFVTSEAAAE